MKRSLLFNIFLIVFIDLLGFGLILPLLPYYASEFNASEGQIGLLVATYAGFQMIGAPILGRLSDRYGRRPILLISICGTVIGFLLLAWANALWLLFLSRAIDGITGGNISVAQAYIADVTDRENRARGLGLIGAAFGLGFVFGPAIGGALSVYGFAVPAYAAAVLGTISFLGVLFFIPETLTAERKQELAESNQAAFNLSTLLTNLQKPHVGPLLNIRLIFALAFNTFQTIFSLYALTRFNLTAQQTGFILAYIGILVVILQGVGIGPITRRFSESWLIVVSIILGGIALFGWAVTPSVPVLLVVLIPMAVGVGIFNTVINSSLSKAVAPPEVGGILGLSSSLESMTRVVSPTASGFLLERLGTAVPGLVGATLMALILPYAWFKLMRSPSQVDT